MGGQEGMESCPDQTEGCILFFIPESGGCMIHLNVSIYR
jgi:hypothetical protein